MSLKGIPQTPEHAAKHGLARRQEFCKNGHLLAETRLFSKDSQARGCRICKHYRDLRPAAVEAKAQTSRMYHYGLTVADYDGMLRRQSGRCAICGTLPGKKRLAVDHNHESGNIRGLLCDNCNRGMGLLGDSPEMLLEAAAYLRGQV